MSKVSSISYVLLWVVLFRFSYTSPTVPFAPRALVFDDPSKLRSEYDYVIIGGGTSGLVVANRLTEDPGSTQHHGQSYMTSRH